MKRNNGVMWMVLASLLPAAGVTYGQVIDQVFPSNTVREAAITAQIKVQLSAHDSAAMNQVTVRTDAHGVVWLAGTVATQALADQAEQIARNVVGVNSVNNQIIVKAGT